MTIKEAAVGELYGIKNELEALACFGHYITITRQGEFYGVLADVGNLVCDIVEPLAPYDNFVRGVARELLARARSCVVTRHNCEWITDNEGRRVAVIPLSLQNDLIVQALFCIDYISRCRYQAMINKEVRNDTGNSKND